MGHGEGKAHVLCEATSTRPGKYGFRQGRPASTRNSGPSDDLWTIVQAAETKGGRVRTFVRLAVATGCRNGELVGLTWDRVNLSEKRSSSSGSTVGQVRFLLGPSASTGSGLRRTRRVGWRSSRPRRVGPPEGALSCSIPQPLSSSDPYHVVMSMLKDRKCARRLRSSVKSHPNYTIFEIFDNGNPRPGPTTKNALLLAGICPRLSRHIPDVDRQNHSDDSTDRHQIPMSGGIEDPSDANGDDYGHDHSDESLLCHQIHSMVVLRLR
jgi:hypothetical protein